MKYTVSEVMDTRTYAVSADLPIRDAIDVLVDRGVTGIPVLNANGQVLGILSEEHCLKLIAEGDTDYDVPKGTVSAYFDADVPQVSSDMDIYYVAGMFLRELKHRRFAVVDDGKLVGVITRKDILRAVRNHLPKSTTSDT
jgi:CBS domain-containing protein